MALVPLQQPVRLAVIGDSFTEGVGDEVTGYPRGWADLVALGLAERAGGIEYANLAIRGRLLTPIMTDQVDQALSLDPLPTVMTVNGGGNDMLRPGIEVGALVAKTVTALERLRDAGITAVALAGPDPSAHLPGSRVIHARGRMLTDAIAAQTSQRGIPFISIFDDAQIRDRRYWAADRLHLNSAGHARAADIVLRGLGIDLPERPAPAPFAGPACALSEARYYRQHVLPWATRRLRRRSSGDGRAAKYPTWVRVAG